MYDILNTRMFHFFNCSNVWWFWIFKCFNIRLYRYVNVEMFDYWTYERKKVWMLKGIIRSLKMLECFDIWNVYAWMYEVFDFLNVWKVWMFWLFECIIFFVLNVWNFRMFERIKYLNAWYVEWLNIIMSECFNVWMLEYIFCLNYGNGWILKYISFTFQMFECLKVWNFRFECTKRLNVWMY